MRSCKKFPYQKAKISLKHNIPTRKTGNTTLKLEDAYVGQ